ncbi:hypothetical protein [Serratia fonticola]
MRMINNRHLIVAMLLLPPLPALAETSVAQYVNDIHKKSVDNIKSNAMCDKWAINLKKPQFVGKAEGFMMYQAIYSDNVGVNFYFDGPHPGEIEIVTTRLPSTFEQQLESFCVISAIQIALEPQKDAFSYMAIDEELYQSALQSKDASYESDKYEYSVSIDESTGMLFSIAPIE